MKQTRGKDGIIRVLHLTTDARVSGAEKLLVGMAKRYDRRRFQFYFCTMRCRGPLHEQIEQFGCQAFSLRCERLWSVPIAMARLYMMLARLKIDILHTHLFHASVLGQSALFFDRAAQGVLTKHYTDLLYEYGNIWKVWADRYACARARKIIAISNSVKQVLTDKDRVPPGKISVIYNGIDLESFCRGAFRDVTAIRAEFALAPSHRVVLAVGSLQKFKGHRYLIEAADIICRSHPDVRFLIVGDGSLKQELLRLRYAFDLEDKVLLPGYRPDIFDIINASDVVVQPSLKEGLGLSVLEAMAVGKPVVGSNVDGIPEIIRHDATGLLVPPRDPVALAEAIMATLTRTKRARAIEEIARDQVQVQFDISVMTRKYEELYDTL